MKTWTWLGSAALATSLAVVACGSGSPPPPTEDMFCDQKAAKECQVTDRCGLPSKDPCLAQRKAICLSFAAAAKVAPRVFHPENIGNCVGKTGNVYAKTTITPADLADMNDACNKVFQGNVEKGSACTVNYDCKGAAICDKGFCGDKVTKGAGQPCGNPGEGCSTGQYCTNAAGAYMCVARKSMDSACDTANPCVEALRCAGTCMARLSVGGACTSDDDCLAAAPYCDPYSGSKCEVGLVFASGTAAACADYGGTPVGAGTGGASGDGGGTGGVGGGDGGGGDGLADGAAVD